MISCNTDFEADVASGKISPKSLQGQFTNEYFPGNQNELIESFDDALKGVEGTAPYAMGTTIPITTHGKTFYFTAMSLLNDQGNSSSTIDDVKQALGGLWSHVRQAGELQELAVPLVGTGRGRVPTTRQKMIELIAESFVKTCKDGTLTDRLAIVVRPKDAKKFQVNLYDIKDHLRRSIVP